jgi:NADH:ubiquinone oxidoreductase subunit 4 (subunit M)
MAALVIAIVWLGFYPRPLVDAISPVLDTLQQTRPSLYEDKEERIEALKRGEQR